MQVGITSDFMSVKNFETVGLCIQYQILTETIGVRLFLFVIGENICSQRSGSKIMISTSPFLANLPFVIVFITHSQWAQHHKEFNLALSRWDYFPCLCQSS